MRVCSSCGRQNPDDRDFCECGEYLRWEPTGFMPSVDAAQVAAEAPAPQPQPPPQPQAAPPPPPPGAAAPPPPPPPPAAAAPPPPPPPPAPAPAPPAPAAPAQGGNGVAPGDPLAGSQPPAPAPQPPAPAPQPPAQPAAPTTAVRAAVPAAPAAPQVPAQPAEPALASITLRVPDVEGTPGDTVAIGCDPGGRARLVALVRNASGIVDNYTLEVAGLPAEWYTIAPNPVYLVPFGSAGAYEQEVEVHLHPPRTPEAEARIWHLQVTAHSAAYAREAASAPLVLGIQPYEEYEPRLKPEKASGRRAAGYDVAVHNKANAPVTVVLGIKDAEDALTGTFSEREIEVPAGETTTSRLSVAPPGKIWIGRPVEHRFEVLAKTGEEAERMLAEEEAAKAAAAEEKEGGGGLGKHVQGPRVQLGPSGVQGQGPRANVRKPTAPSKNLGLESLKKPGGAAAPQWSAPLLPTQAIFRQKPIIPRWAALLVLLLLLAAVLLFLLIPRNVAVPDLVGQKVFDGEKALTEAKLALNPVVKEQVSEEEPGTIIDQTPAPGEKVRENSQVSVVQAVGDGSATVPDVVGQDFAAASTAIDKAKLTVGPVNPQPPAPELKVESTIPAAGEVVAEGKAIQVFLETPESRAAGAAGAGGEGDEAGAGGEGGGEANIVVPPIDGRPLDEYAAEIGELGLIPEQVASFTDQAEPGTLFGTDPEGGTNVAAGDTVKLLVSKGIPQVAYDNDKDILLVSGIDGKKLETVAKSPQRELQPSFNVTGTAMVFVSNDQLRLSNRLKPDEPPVKLTTGSDKYRLPVFAPTSDSNLLAALKLRDDDSGAGDLCIGPVTRSGWESTCLSQPGQAGFFNVLRWAPDGKSIFSVGARGTGTAQRTGIYRWRSNRAFAPDASDWGKASVITDDSEPGKAAIDLNISPDGEQMAVVANFETDGFQLYLTKPGDFELANAKLQPVRACKAAWRPDSLELAIVQGDDCTQPGEVARVSINDPRRSVSLGLKGDSPAYQPPKPDDADG